MKTTVAAVITLVALSSPATQDREFVRAYERAQADKPAEVGAVGRIASEGEPGSPLVINGRLYLQDGRTPAPGITVFAYQTDASGVYDVPSKGQHVHLHIEGPNVPRRWTTELTFDDDPELTTRDRDVARRAGRFGGVRPVIRRDGVDHVDINLKIENRGLF